MRKEDVVKLSRRFTTDGMLSKYESRKRFSGSISDGRMYELGVIK